MLYTYCSSFIDYILWVFAPNKYLRRLEEKQALKFSLDNARKINELYQKSLEEIVQLRVRLVGVQRERDVFYGDTIHLREQIGNYKNEIESLQNNLKHSVSLDSNLSMIKKLWIEHNIERLNKSSYGAGQIYELYEARKQSAISTFLCKNASVLTQEEIEVIKQKTDYIENFEPYSEVDQVTGEVSTLSDIVFELAGVAAAI